MTSSIFSLVLPIVLAVVMFGLGLDLTFTDFARVARAPVAVVAVLVCQVVLLPALGFGLVVLTDLPPDLALGMMVLLASPGGAMAAVFSHLAGGDVALNISATAVNAVLALVTMPAVTVFSVRYFVGIGATPSAVPPDKIVQVFVVVLVPVVLGMLLRARRPSMADRWHRPIRVISVVAVFLAIATAVGQQLDGFLLGLASVGLVALLLSVLSLAVGYAVPRLLRVGHARATASAMEIGIHNAVLAITVCVSVLDNPAAAVAPAMYGALMFGPAGALAWLLARRRRHVGDRASRRPVARPSG